jgi:PAS domain S-box-containing protein
LIWQETLFIVALLAVAAISVASALYTWSRRPVPGSKAVAVLALASAEWLAAYALELASVDVLDKVFLNKVQFVGVVIVPVAWLLFALQYTRREEWLTRRTLLALSIMPLVTLLLVFTNESHGLFWEGPVAVPEATFAMLHQPHGAWFWIHVAYSYALHCISTFLLVRMLIHSRHLYRRQVSALLLASNLPLLGNAVMFLGLSPWAFLDLTLLGFVVSSQAIIWSLFRLRVGDIVPVAHEVIIDNMSDGVIVLDEQGRIVNINTVAQQVIGHAASAAIGNPVERIFPQCAALIQSLSDRSGRDAEIVVGEGDARRTYDVGISSILDWRGRLTSQVVVLRDITERVGAEQALRRSEEYFRALTENASDSIIVLEDDGTIRFQSPSLKRVLGYGPEGGGGQNAFAFVHPDDVPKAMEIFTDVRCNPGVVRFADLRFRHNDGSWRIFESVGKTLPARSGMKGVVVNSHDVTERVRATQEIRKLNEELEQRVAERTAQMEASNKELEAFAYSVSHDLRTPLRAIDGFGLALLEDYASCLDAQGQDYLRRVRAASQRLGQLIDDLLDLSRMTRGEMRREAVDLSALAGEIAAELEATQPERETEFIIAPGVVVNGDARLLWGMLENLLGNAWKFTGKNTRARIEFGVIEIKGRPAYFVRDDGVGFEMAYADKLFGAFQRLHGMNEFEGNGIGLATVQRVVHRHGGRVWAESTVGQGATFYFTL